MKRDLELLLFNRLRRRILLFYCYLQKLFKNSWLNYYYFIVEIIIKYNWGRRDSRECVPSIKVKNIKLTKLGYLIKFYNKIISVLSKRAPLGRFPSPPTYTYIYALSRFFLLYAHSIYLCMLKTWLERKKRILQLIRNLTIWLPTRWKRGIVLTKSFAGYIDISITLACWWNFSVSLFFWLKE